MVLPEYLGQNEGKNSLEEFPEYHEVSYLFDLSKIRGHKFGRDLIRSEVDNTSSGLPERILVINGPVSDIEKELRASLYMNQFLMPIIATNSQRTIYGVPLSAEELDKITVNLGGLATFRNTNIGKKLEDLNRLLMRFPKAYSVIKEDRLAAYQASDQAGSDQYNLLIIPFFDELIES